MRKYSIPKFMYIFVSAILLCFSLGYTYAYFSATAVAEGVPKMNRVKVYWSHIVAATHGDIDELQIYNESNTICLTNDLKRGFNVPIEAQTYSNGTPVYDNSGNPVTSKLKLGLKNESTISTYVRIKLTAVYLDGTETIDISQYVKLTLYNETQDRYKQLTDSDWFYHTDGYYYRGASVTDLKSLSANYSLSIADYIYLDPASSADLYGKEISITLKLEAIQAQHNAHVSEWGLPAQSNV